MAIDRVRRGSQALVNASPVVMESVSNHPHPQVGAGCSS